MDRSGRQVVTVRITKVTVRVTEVTGDRGVQVVTGGWIVEGVMMPGSQAMDVELLTNAAEVRCCLPLRPSPVTFATLACYL